jgi:hypothetical protein
VALSTKQSVGLDNRIESHITKEEAKKDMKFGAVQP